MGLTIPTDGSLTLALPWRGFFFTPALVRVPPIKPLVTLRAIAKLGRVRRRRFGAGRYDFDDFTGPRVNPFAR